MPKSKSGHHSRTQKTNPTRKKTHRKTKKRSPMQKQRRSARSFREEAAFSKKVYERMRHNASVRELPAKKHLDMLLTNYKKAARRGQKAKAALALATATALLLSYIPVPSVLDKGTFEMSPPKSGVHALAATGTLLKKNDPKGHLRAPTQPLSRMSRSEKRKYARGTRRRRRDSRGRRSRSRRPRGRRSRGRRSRGRSP